MNYPGEKEYTPPPWDPSFLGLSPNPSQSKKELGVYHFPGKTREKGIHHRSGKKGIHHIASDLEKEKKKGLHGGGVWHCMLSSYLTTGSTLATGIACGLCSQRGPKETTLK